jgi:hypothetical protein
MTTYASSTEASFADFLTERERYAAEVQRRRRARPGATPFELSMPDDEYKQWRKKREVTA